MDVLIASILALSVLWTLGGTRLTHYDNLRHFPVRSATRGPRRWGEQVLRVGSGNLTNPMLQSRSRFEYHSRAQISYSYRATCGARVECLHDRLLFV